MKKLVVLFFILCVANLSAQEETLFGDKPVEHGGFGGPVVKFTQVNGEFAALVGGRGGWIINHSFVIGGGGYGLANTIDADYYVDGVQQNIEMGYGGLELEYISRPNSLMHLSLYALVGAGGVTMNNRDFWDDDDDDYYDLDDDTDDPDVFFVFAPEINAELNITTFFRIGAGAGYRFVTGVSKFGLGNSDIGGFTGSLTFKFGAF